MGLGRLRAPMAAASGWLSSGDAQSAHGGETISDFDRDPPKAGGKSLRGSMPGESAASGLAGQRRKHAAYCGREMQPAEFLARAKNTLAAMPAAAPARLCCQRYRRVCVARHGCPLVAPFEWSD